MKPHIIRVALDKDVLMDEADAIREKNDGFLSVAFEGRHVKYYTTFTSKVDHSQILNTPAKSLQREDQILQQLILIFNVSYGKEFIEDCLNLNIQIEHAPDIVITKNKSKYEILSRVGIMVFEKTQQVEIISLSQAIPLHFFSSCTKLLYWRIRIEDRYFLHHLETEKSIKDFVGAIIKGQHLHQIEITYSGNDYDYRNLTNRSILSRHERERRKQLIKKIAYPNEVRFIEGAGHDRYVATNNCLIILGHSILTNRETHITTFPFLTFYKRFFGIDKSLPT